MLRHTKNLLKTKGKNIAIMKKLVFYWHSKKPIIETNSSISNTILILGSGRSGTTWVGSICAKMLKARQIFEPFILDVDGNFFFLYHHFFNNKIQPLMNYSLYLSFNMKIDQSIFSQIEKILKGKIRSYWTDRYTDIGIYSKRIIKDIRVNLFLEFLARQWPEMKIIWIVRNPIDVVKSQLYLKVKYGWEFDLDENILAQKQLIKDALSPFVKFIKKAKTLPERLMHRWCIENFVPLNQKVQDLPNVLLVFYDKLVNSQKEWKRLNYFMDKNIWNSSTLKNYLSVPSVTYVKKDVDKRDFFKKYNFCEKKLVDIIKIYNLEKFFEDFD